MKGVSFVGPSLDVLRAFPKSARHDIGYQIDRVQRGLEPNDWKAMPSVGPGVREIRVHDEGKAYRCVYVANIEEAVYVLHVFVKKSRRTSKRDVETARMRLRFLRSEFRKRRQL